MSSTNRKNAAQRNAADYYITPQYCIGDFLHAFKEDFDALKEITGQFDSDIVNPWGDKQITIIDPCAGGDAEYPMSYPEAIRKCSGWNYNDIDTCDIREDSLAKFKGDYLSRHVCEGCYDMAITNPPFNIALEIIKRTLADVHEGGWVIMLLRLNFFGSQERSAWFKENMPLATYVHSQRISFVPDDRKKRINDEAKAAGVKAKGNGTDSIEYMHAVWCVGCRPQFTQLRII